jgi:hypothetical protein
LCVFRLSQTSTTFFAVGYCNGMNSFYAAIQPKLLNS